MFVLEGIVLILLGLIRPAPGILVGTIVVGIAALLIVVFAYSYQVWSRTRLDE